VTDRHLPDPLPEPASGPPEGSSPGLSAPVPPPAAHRTQAATADTAVAAPVSALDRLTLQLGVVVAAVIALCSYAVSATSLYALGRQAGYAAWQALAVPVVADGPAIYGMVRIISRARRSASGAGYGWLLVVAGTAASIAGNVAHAQPGLVARGIAAAIPLAVLAMLEALKGDTQEVARLVAQAVPAAATEGPADATVVRRADHPAGVASLADTQADTQADILAVGQLAARPPTADTSVRGRLQAAYASARADGHPWTARTLADAAGCGRTAAARFLQGQREAGGEARS
jgi:Protein of unknown function (DUF2637)